MTFLTTICIHIQTPSFHSNIAQEPLAPPIPFQLTPPHFYPPSNPTALEAAVEEVLALWRQATRPVIVVGGKVRACSCMCMYMLGFDRICDSYTHIQHQSRIIMICWLL